MESERDQLRAERDKFRSILSAANRYPFQTQQAQLASLGLAPAGPNAPPSSACGAPAPLRAAARPAADLSP